MTLHKAIQYHTLNTLLWTRNQRPLHWARTRMSSRAAVLMYHSIGEVEIDPWGLHVSPSNFAEHLDVLRSSSKVMRLSELADGCAEGTLPHRSTAITFDDGYFNNLCIAKPLLEAAGLPATIFIVNEGVDRPGEFWWDQLAALLLRPGPLPDRLSLSFDASRPNAVFELGPATAYSQQDHHGDREHHDGKGPASDRMRFYQRMWEELVDWPDSRRTAAIEEIGDWAGYSPPTRDSHRIVTSEELRELQGCELIDLGAHTLTHPMLPRLSVDDQRREIYESKRELEARLSAPVELFSYPFGGHDATSVELSGRAGYTTAVTTEPATASARSQPLRLPRFDVKNWTGEEFERRLSRWLRFR